MLYSFCSIGRVVIIHAAWITGLLVFAACSEKAVSLDQLIERNLEASGEKTALTAVQSIKFDLHIVDPGFEVDGTYYAARPGKMRVDINAGGKHVYTEAFNGNRAWQWKGEGDPVEESDKATAALRHGVELPGKLFSLDEVRERGNRLELVGREKVEGLNYHVVRLTLSDGYSTTLYIDPKTWLIARRRDVRPLHVDIDPTPTTIENRSSDFRKVQGLILPFASVEVDLKTGKELEKTTVRSITLNPPIDPAFFDAL